MDKVYLDNNILSSIEDQEYSIESIIRCVGNHKVEFPYSSAHIQEADNYLSDNEKDHLDFLKKRILTIQNISNNHYVYFNRTEQKATFETREPIDVLITIKDIPQAKSAMQLFSNLFSKDEKKSLREQLKIDMIKINNYQPNEIIEHLNTKISILGISESCVGFLDMAINMFPNGHTFSLIHRFAGLFEFLDLLGYWKDKQTETSNYARFWDSQHAYYGSLCQYFISDDFRTRKKARVIYDLYKIDTKIMDSNGKE
jgi:hypothetical protein